LRRLINDLGMILLALFLAVIVWVVALQEENPVEQGEFPNPIPVQVLNQPEETIFFPRFEESVKLTIRAPRSSWNSLRASKFTATIDLAGRGGGDYEAEVKVACTDPNVRIIELSPATVPVHLKKQVSRQVPVQIELYGTVALGYDMKTDEAVIEPETVAVTGPEPIVEQVTKATVVLYLREDVKETIRRDMPVVARVEGGNSVGTFVSIEPDAVSITIPVEQRTGFNEVAVRPVVIGAPAPGYRLRGVSVDPTTVTLVGDPNVVSEIEGSVENVPLDISGATGDVVERVALDLPEGASVVGIQGVLLTASIEPLPGRLNVYREPIVRGLSTDLAARVSPERVVVALTGPLPRLNALSQEDVQVYAELVDLGAGQYRIELTYLVPEGLQIESIVPSTVDVEISRVMPTPRPTLTPTPTPILTGTVTGTVSISGTVGVTVTPTGIAAPEITPSPTPTRGGSPTPVPALPSPTPAVTPTEERQ
jgi:YbbR domain-containing protein